jgi:uncharacterized linocin/CFP29 family protein
MTQDNSQVPWTDEQWARVNQVIQEEASRARVAATFLPLIGPLPADTDFVRKEIISYPARAQQPPRQKIAIQDTGTIQLATLQVKVPLRGAQMADPDMTSVLAVFRRAANVLARLEDEVVFRGLEADALPPANFAPPPPPPSVTGLPQIWEIHGGEMSEGLLAPAGSLLPAAPVPVPPGTTATTARVLGNNLVPAVSDAVGRLERNGHFGPFAVALDHSFFTAVQTPTSSLVLPQDRIVPFLGGGPLLRSSTLPKNSGVVVALGGAPIELVIATDVSLQFLQLTDAPNFLFRVREKMALRIKEAGAIVTLAHDAPQIWSISPRSGPIAGAAAQVTIRGIYLAGATHVDFGRTRVLGASLNISPDGLSITVPLPPAAAPGVANVTVDVAGAVSNAEEFTYI